VEESEAVGVLERSMNMDLEKEELQLASAYSFTGTFFGDRQF
jgi:hypothetical protein